MNNMLRMVFVVSIAVIFVGCQTTQPELNVTNVVGSTVVRTENAEAREAYNTGSELLLREGDAEGALPFLLRAIELDPEFVDAVDHLAIAYRRLGELDKAIETNLYSLELYPENVTAMINIALVYRQQDDLENAKNYYRKVMEIDRDNPEGYYGMGSLYFTLREWEASNAYMIQAYDLYRALRSEYVIDAIYYMAYNHYNLKEWEQSLEYFKIIAENFPKDEEIASIVLDLEEKLGN
jgi:tetratricopeptide (TPR) repeat protein